MAAYASISRLCESHSIVIAYTEHDRCHNDEEVLNHKVDDCVWVLLG